MDEPMMRLVEPIQRCIENIEAAGSSMYSYYRGEHVEQLATGIDCYRVREPVGVFLIITPATSPCMHGHPLCLMRIACGCPVIVKPSRYVSFGF